MRHRSRNQRAGAAGTESCPICGVQIKSKNLNGHLKRVHPEDAGNKSKSKGGLYEERSGPQSKSDRRKAQMNKRRKQDMMFVIFIVIFAVVGIGGYFLYDNYIDTGNGDNAEDIQPEPAKESPNPIPNDPNSNGNSWADNEIPIPIADVNDGKAHFYTYNSNGVQIRYFVLKSSDDVYRAAFDTCDVCYDAKKGYRQEGDDMVCNNCGQRFPSVKINVEKGGCNPAPLERTVKGGYLVITTDALDTGRWYFA